MSTIKLRPLRDHLVVEPEEIGEMTASGVFLPETARGKTQEGIVLTVGPGRQNEEGDFLPIGIQENDRVIFAKYAGTEIELDSQKVLILKASDVLAIREKDSD